MKNLCILGATGSIGVSTLDVISRHPDKYKVIALSANTNIALLYQQCIQFKPKYAVVVNPDKALILQQQLAQANITTTKILSGTDELVSIATLENVDMVMAAIVGAAGLLPTLAAAQAGKTVLLANKEALVMSGQLFMQAVVEAGATLLPIDSEHNAIFQCMPAQYKAGDVAKSVRKILLTASGGPFRITPIADLEHVTPEQAVAHPKWDMGRKISVDSATMMNKGLELIEACLLFNLSPTQVQVVIHQQSIIHSMVDYVDGSVLAQMGNPDMRIPIAHAMAYPERIDSGVAALDIFSVAQMDFTPPDLNRFPCLKLAQDAIQAGGIMPTVLNAANEIAVAEFLNETIKFTDIAKVIAKTMTNFDAGIIENLTQILHVDQAARTKAQTIIAELNS